ncbi:MAG: hypothetical protein ACREN7_05245 [Candidatus Dormibacteria bacterium]
MTIRGRFWLDAVTLRLSGLRPGRNYSFDSGKDGHVEVTLSLAGVISPGSTHFHPESGIPGQAGQTTGQLSVAKGGRSGSLDITPGSSEPQIAGRWRCAAAQPGVATKVPVLNYFTGPPVVDECWLPGQYAADGDSVPVRCSNGDINVWAWTDTFPGTLAKLGENATPGQVRAALCQSIRSGEETDTLESGYQFVQTYYGWQVGVDPEALVATNSCQ